MRLDVGNFAACNFATGEMACNRRSSRYRCLLDETNAGAPTRKGSRMADGVNMIALSKDGERFVFLYDDNSPAELLRTFGQYAADPELNFSWYDAAVLSQRVRASIEALEANKFADDLLPFRPKRDDADDSDQRRAA